MATTRRSSATKLSANFILASFDEFKEDALIIDFSKKNKSKDGNVEYCSISIKTPTSFAGSYPDASYPILINFAGLNTFSCKPYKVRQEKKMAASFSFKANSVDSRNEPIGEACLKIIDAWKEKLMKNMDERKKHAKINDPIQRGLGKPEEESFKPFEKGNELIRIKFKTVNQKTDEIKGLIGYVTDKLDNEGRPKVAYTSPKGKKITVMNIHEVVTSGVSSGVIDLASFNYTAYGYSLSSSCSAFVIRQMQGGQFSQEDIDYGCLGVATSSDVKQNDNDNSDLDDLAEMTLENSKSKKKSKKRVETSESESEEERKPKKKSSKSKSKKRVDSSESESEEETRPKKKSSKSKAKSKKQVESSESESEEEQKPKKKSSKAKERQLSDSDGDSNASNLDAFD